MYQHGGMHIFIDVWTECKYDKDVLMTYLQEACLKAGSTTIDTHIHSFDENHCSFTGVIILAESHASVHTWPEHGYIGIDFFFCGKVDYDGAITHLVNSLEYDKIRVSKHNRGDTE